MANKKEWTKLEVQKLISIYQENPILWDHKYLDYRNKEKKQATVQRIAEEFDCAVEEIQRKLHNLRNQVSQEIKKIKKKSSRTGKEMVYVSSWPYFESLKFLIPALLPNPTHSTIPAQLPLIPEYTQPPGELFRLCSKPEANGSELARSTAGEDYWQKKEHKRKPCPAKKTKYENPDSELFKPAVEVLQKQPDDDDIFGQYVATELRGLKSDFYKRKLKSVIRKAIVDIADEHDSYISETSCMCQPNCSVHYERTTPSSIASSTSPNPMQYPLSFVEITKPGSPADQQDIKPDISLGSSCGNDYQSFSNGESIKF